MLKALLMTLGLTNDEIVLITNGNDEKKHIMLISYIENNFKD